MGVQIKFFLEFRRAVFELVDFLQISLGPFDVYVKFELRLIAKVDSDLA